MKRQSHLYLFAVFAAFIAFFLATDFYPAVDPDAFRTPIEIIISRGFEAEEHFVTTEDGFVLGLQRIINPYRNKSEALRPVLLQHAFLVSSAEFLINSPGFLDENGHYIEIDDSGQVRDVGNTLGFVLAEKGFDVWLGNTRTNWYSSNHTDLKDDDVRYWQFTIDDLVRFDLTATIDYVLNSLAYIGHSQGTTLMLGLLASNEKYNNIIETFIAITPLTFFDYRYVTSPFKYLTYLNDIFVPNPGPFPGIILPSKPLHMYMSKKLCGSMLGEQFCANLLFLSCGYNKPNLNYTRLRVYTAHAPHRTSRWNLVHIMQIQTRFQHFDFGIEANKVRYGTEEPPLYDLGKISLKRIAFFHSKGDWMAVPQCIDRLRKSLKVKLLDDYLVPDENYNHLDFVWGKDSGKYVNSRILKLLQNSGS